MMTVCGVCGAYGSMNYELDLGTYTSEVDCCQARLESIVTYCKLMYHSRSCFVNLTYVALFGKFAPGSSTVRDMVVFIDFLTKVAEAPGPPFAFFLIQLEKYYMRNNITFEQFFLWLNKQST